MTWVALRREYVERFEAVDLVRRCEDTDAVFDDAELARIGALGTPFVRVVIAEADDDEDDISDDGANPTKAVRWLAFVAAQRNDIDKHSASDVAALVAGRLVRELEHGAKFASATSGRPRCRIYNATTTKTAREGRAIFVVEWVQGAVVSDAADLVLVPLNTIHTEYTFDGVAPNPEDTVTDLQDAPP